MEYAQVELKVEEEGKPQSDRSKSMPSITQEKPAVLPVYPTNTQKKVNALPFDAKPINPSIQIP